MDEDLRSRRVIDVQAQRGQTVTLDKLIAVATSRDIDVVGSVAEAAARLLAAGLAMGFDALLSQQQDAWSQVWRTLAIEVREKSGSGALTQGVRYSLFQMLAERAQRRPHGEYRRQRPHRRALLRHLFLGHGSLHAAHVRLLPARGGARFSAFPHAHAARRPPQGAGVGPCRAAYPWMADADGNESCTLWQFALLGVHVTAAVGWSVWFTLLHHRRSRPGGGRRHRRAGGDGALLGVARLLSSRTAAL